MSEVAEFFRGRSVLVTGASGFMGKVLVEKLLYSCSDLRAIYILMRTKRNTTPELRTEEILKLPVSVPGVSHVGGRSGWLFQFHQAISVYYLKTDQCRFPSMSF
jgi:NAD(P)-dependent dehydrogenase (short-subunit alcohol dehydrogenase family)